MLAAAGRLQLQEYVRFYAGDATLVRTLLRHVVRPDILPCKVFGSKKFSAVFWSTLLSSRGLELARCKRHNPTETAKDAVSPSDHDCFILARVLHHAQSILSRRDFECLYGDLLRLLLRLRRLSSRLGLLARPCSRSLDGL